jgi:hypothetical protein
MGVPLNRVLEGIKVEVVAAEFNLLSQHLIGRNGEGHEEPELRWSAS